MSQVEEAELIYDGYERVLLVTVVSPTGTRQRIQIGDHGAGVCVFPFDPLRRVATVVRQQRAALLFVGQAETILESPGGLVESDDPAADAIRETVEEAGIAVRNLELVGHMWPMPGLSTERLSIYLGTYSAADRIGPGGGLAQEGEDIEVLELPLAELARMADRGELTDLRTFAALQTLRLRRPELFR